MLGHSCYETGPSSEKMPEMPNSIPLPQSHQPETPYVSSLGPESFTIFFPLVPLTIHCSWIYCLMDSHSAILSALAWSPCPHGSPRLHGGDNTKWGRRVPERWEPQSSIPSQILIKIHLSWVSQRQHVLMTPHPNHGRIRGTPELRAIRHAEAKVFTQPGIRNLLGLFFWNDLTFLYSVHAIIIIKFLSLRIVF